MSGRRMAAAALAAGAALAWLPWGRGGETSAAVRAEDAIVEGEALATAATVVAFFEPNFDFWPVYSSSRIDNSSSRSLAAAFWPGFLVDATFFQFGYQDFERSGMGISESLYPSGPRDASASSTAFMRSNFALGCELLFGTGPGTGETCKRYSAALITPPGSLGESESSSGPLASQGTARGTRFSVPGVIDAAEAISRTSARFDAASGRTVVEASFTARDVTIGSPEAGAVLRIAKLIMTSRSVAGGDPDSSSASTEVRLVDATFGGSSVTIDDAGLHLQGEAATAQPTQPFRDEGLDIRLVRGRREVSEDGQVVLSSTGGLLVSMSRQRTEERFPRIEPQWRAIWQQRDAACRAVAASPLNREVARVDQRLPNPVYGPLQSPPDQRADRVLSPQVRQAVPAEVPVSQSVPPPAPCPSLNRDPTLAFVLGDTRAVARLTPLPPLEEPGAGPPPEGAIGEPGIEPVAAGEPLVVGGAEAFPSAAARPARPARGTRAAAPLYAVQRESDVVAKVKVLYGVLAVLGLLGLGAPWLLRRVSAP